MSGILRERLGGTINYTIMIATHRAALGDDAMTMLIAHNPIRVDGTNAPSCSALWNACIDMCPTDICIICNEKARPHDIYINKMLNLIDEGYGIVGLYRFGFFGFHKDLIKAIGRFDERYLGGWYEDNDAILRLKEANIALYESEEIAYIQIPSAWHHSGAANHFRSKWAGTKRLLPEEPEPEGTTRKFLPWSKSVLMEKSGAQYNKGEQPRY
jgi:hypothetical protein